MSQSSDTEQLYLISSFIDVSFNQKVVPMKSIFSVNIDLDSVSNDPLTKPVLESIVN